MRSAIEDQSLQDQLDCKVGHLLNISQFINANKSLVQAHIEDSLENTADSLYPLKFKIKDLFDDLRLDYSVIDSSFVAFSDLGGESWDPYLTIPYKSNIIAAGNYSNTNPYYAIPNYDLANNVDKVNVYSEQGGSLVPFAGTLSESNKFYFTLHTIDIDSQGSGFGGGNGTGSGYTPLEIDKMTPKQHKEPWIAGRSEVHIKGYKIINLPNTSGDCGDDITGGANCFNYDGRRIKRVKRDDIGDEFNADYILHNFSSINSADVVFYVIFENDPWPATQKQAVYQFPNGMSRIIKFRSWESSYHQATVSLDPNNTNGFPYARTYSVDINSIKYNLQ
ncbi:hypothetical protein [Mangrovimonas futianensis]|uniref:hypothetical protein n=1 Tax=Mangrovimonas futianensis TaxID=2895523 RepID=UPI001E2F74E4|nr:hypothetical protein [Mangrovimonas futianensis]MCF1420962.1 hypothetical protein [Mangrovimonas futianensis]